MHVNVNDLPGEEIAPGVVERVLITPDQSVPPGFGAKHYTLTNGGTVTFNEPFTEHQHYIISGIARRGGGYAHQDTAIFVPAGNHNKEQQMQGKCIHSFSHAGESETRIITLTFKVPRPAFRWAKSRSRNLMQVLVPHQERWGYAQLHMEEEHAIMGALRMHGLDVQTHPAFYSHHEHRNPEGRLAEVIYFLRGHGEGVHDGVREKVKPGSFLYSGMARGERGGFHGIYNTTEDILQYFVVEIIEHDKSWTARGFHGESLEGSYIFVPKKEDI